MNASNDLDDASRENTKRLRIEAANIIDANDKNLDELVELL